MKPALALFAFAVLAALVLVLIQRKGEDDCVAAVQRIPVTVDYSTYYSPCSAVGMNEWDVTP